MLTKGNVNENNKFFNNTCHRKIIKSSSRILELSSNRYRKVALQNKLCYNKQTVKKCQNQKLRIRRGLRLIEKFMTSQTAQQTITIHNISKSEGNQEVKFW